MQRSLFQLIFHTQRVQSLFAEARCVRASYNAAVAACCHCAPGVMPESLPEHKQRSQTELDHEGGIPILGASMATSKHNNTPSRVVQ
eukprot:3581779-Amphidinium_carterae.3